MCDWWKFTGQCQKNTETQNGPYGPYEHILQDGSQDLWTKSEFWTKTQNLGLQKNWKLSVGTQNGLFEVGSKTETTSKYTLDYSWIFPAHFSYIKIWFWRKIDQNPLKLARSRLQGASRWSSRTQRVRYSIYCTEIHQKYAQKVQKYHQVMDQNFSKQGQGGLLSASG